MTAISRSDSNLIRYALCCGILLWTTTVAAQTDRLRANHWYFGNHFGLDFSSGVPMPDHDNAQNTFEACCTMSDKAGNLLFYTNGGGRVDSSHLGYIWNRNHEVMEGGALGAELGGGYSAAQGALSFPKPGTTDQYYLFTVDELETLNNSSNPFPEGKGLSFFEIDMAANGGLGQVTLSNEKLLSPAFENLTATRHANCTDYWVMTRTGHEYVADDPTVADSFYLFQVTESGISTPLTSPIPEEIYFTMGSATVLRFAPDGAHFFYGNYLFTFDKNTGQIGAPVNLEFLIGMRPEFPLAFSPNGRFLYYFELGEDEPEGSENIFIRAFQYDLWSSLNIFQTVVIYEKILLPAFAQMGTPQLAPDGSLYLPLRYGTAVAPTQVFRVGFPNLKGLGAHFSGPVFSLSHTENRPFLRFGNYPDNFFYYDSLQTIPLDLGLDTTLNCTTPGPVTLSIPNEDFCYLWSNGSVDTSITITQPGLYWVEIEKDCAFGRDTIEVIYENTLFDFEWGADTTLCPGEELLLEGIDLPEAIHFWQDGSNNSSLTVTDAGQYILEVAIEACTDADTIQVGYLPQPEVDLGGDQVICFGDTINLKAGPVEGFTYLWSTGSTAPSINVSEQDFYSVTQSNVCGEAFDEIFVNPVSCGDCFIYIPNTFTPNADQRNDSFGVFSGCAFTYFRFQVFNRWGGLLFDGDSIEQHWDGRLEGQPSPVGVYVYKLEYELVTDRGDRKRGVETGDVTLIR